MEPFLANDNGEYSIRLSIHAPSFRDVIVHKMQKGTTEAMAEYIFSIFLLGNKFNP